MVEKGQDDPRKGRHRFVVNVGGDQDHWSTIQCDDFEVTPEGVHFVRGEEDQARVCAFASHPVLIREAADVAEGEQ